MTIVILRSAVADLVRGRDFYEGLDVGLGSYFEDSLASDIDSLQLYAGIHPQFFGYFRMLSERFPYAIYYTLHDDQIQVQAVLDCRRNPRWTESRLSE